jgi:N-acetylglucosamine kinase-like BadF-type ATPase
VSTASWFLGVDGGATKTISLVARSDGAVAGVGRAGCGNIYATAVPEQTVATVATAVEQALRMAAVPGESVAAGAFSMAGADWPEDLALIEASMRDRGFGRVITVVNDALGALRAGSPDGTGVAVVCGTGAATGSRTADGRRWHSGFWQGTQGADELGERTLNAVYRTALGIDPPTSLTARVLELYEQETVEQLLHRLTARQGDRSPALGRLAPALLDEASRGDATAQRIVESHGEALGDYALVAARQVGLEHTPFTLVLAGGVLRHRSPLLADAVVKRVRAVSPAVIPVKSALEPVVGALLLAFEAADVAVDGRLIERLVASLPPADLFATTQPGGSSTSPP